MHFAPDQNTNMRQQRMKALLHFLVMLGTVAAASCAFLPTATPIYPNPEPNVADETDLTPPKCDMAGQPRDCHYDVRFEKRGGVTVMLAPQCVQVTITDEPPTGDPKHVRLSQTFMTPHEVTVVGDRDAQMEVGLCLQFPLRQPQSVIFEKPTVIIDPKDCHGLVGAGTAAACF